MPHYCGSPTALSTQSLGTVRLCDQTSAFPLSELVHEIHQSFDRFHGDGIIK
jgi:hypothetical protein